MALTQTPAQLRTSVRNFANVAGQTALLRHPDSLVDDAVLRAIGSLYRKLNDAGQPELLFLGSTTLTTAGGQTTYPLPADFASLLSISLTASGVVSWLTDYSLNERPALVSADASGAASGIPIYYSLRGSGFIELLPAPTAGYPFTLWYATTAPQPTGGQAFDVYSRLDDFIVAYAARIVATKDKNWDLVNECRMVCRELEAEIAAVGRSRDQNSLGRINDVYAANRYGRRRWVRR